jgi:hypothetical protein
MKSPLIAAIIAAIVLVLLVAGILAWQAIETHQANVALSERVAELETAQVETYFEGVWALCMVFNAYIATGGGTDFVDCETIVSSGYEMKWHERDAPGFEWPPVAD